MREIAHHILDLVQNSVTANATLIQLIIAEDYKQNRLSIKIVDNGVGMSQEIVEKVIDPFYTTRTTRNVGLGIPMFKVNAEMCGGGMTITSEVGKGTEVYVWFDHNHIDRPPLGDMASTTVGIVLSLESSCDFEYVHCVNASKFVLDTRELREVLGVEVDLSEISVLQWIKEYVAEGLSEIHKESL